MNESSNERLKDGSESSWMNFDSWSMKRPNIGRRSAHENTSGSISGDRRNSGSKKNAGDDEPRAKKGKSPLRKQKQQKQQKQQQQENASNASSSQELVAVLREEDIAAKTNNAAEESIEIGNLLLDPDHFLQVQSDDGNDEESGTFPAKTSKTKSGVFCVRRRRSKRFWVVSALVCLLVASLVVGLVVGLLYSPSSGNGGDSNDPGIVLDNNNDDGGGGLILLPPSATTVLTLPPIGAGVSPPSPPPTSTTVPPTPVPIDHCPRHSAPAAADNITAFVFYESSMGLPIAVSSNTFASGTDLDLALLQSCGNGGGGVYDLGSRRSNNSTAAASYYGGRGIWYVLEGPGGVVVASTCNFFNPATFDTQISVFSSASPTCHDGLVCVTTDDDSCEYSNSSRATWFAEEGRKYYILVHGARTDQSGGFELNLELAPVGTCDAAISVPISINTQQQPRQPPMIGTLLGATLSMDPCSAGVVGRGGEIWYQASVSDSGGGRWLIASTCHGVNEFPPRLALYMGDCTSLRCATPMHYQQDNDCGLGNSLTWYASPGEVYYLLVYKTNYLPGVTFGLTVEELTPPANDNCTGAIELRPDGTIVYGSTLRATYVRSEAEYLGCNVTYSHPGVWYSVRGTGATLTASTCDDATNFDTKVSVYGAVVGGGLCSGGGGGLYCVVGNDQWCGYQSSVDWNSTLGGLYYILVHGSQEGGVAPSIGNFGLAVYEFTPTANNDCRNAIGPLPVDSSAATYGSTLTASVDRIRSVCADGIGNEAPGVWYTVIGTGEGIHASTCGPETDFDTRITIYEYYGTMGGCDQDYSLQCLITDDNGCGFQSQVYWPSVAGRVYYVLVHGNFFSSFGHFRLRMSPYYPNTIHDFCSHALYAQEGVLNVGSTRNATFDGVETCVVPNTAPGVWYRVDGTGNRMIASTCHIVTDYDTRISVFTGSCTNLECIAGNDDGIDDNTYNDDCGSSGSSRLSWLSNPGQSYFILVHGWGARTGVFGLTIEEAAPSVPNDFCVGALPLWQQQQQQQNNNNNGATVTGGVVVGGGAITLQQRGSNVNATFDNVPVCGDIEFNGRGVWYQGRTRSSSSRASNTFVVSTCNSDTSFDTQISVFRGSCGNLECVGGNNDDPRCEENNNKPSSVTFLIPNYDEIFYILVHGAAPPDDIGQFTLVLQELSSQRVINDICTDAMRIPVIVTPDEIENNAYSSSSATITTTTASNFVVTGSTIDASYDNVGTCVVPNTSPGVWYIVTGTGHELTATTCHEETDFDTRLSVFQIGGGDKRSGGSSVRNDDDSNNNNYIIDVFTRQDDNAAANYARQKGGDCEHRLECVTGNDDTSIAKTVTVAQTPSDLEVVILEEQYPSANGCGARSTASWSSTSGETYYILVHGFSAHVGNFALSVEERGIFDR